MEKIEPWVFKGRETPTRLKRMTLRAFSEGMITPDKAEQICLGCCESIEENMEDKIHYSPRDTTVRLKYDFLTLEPIRVFLRSLNEGWK